MFQIPRYIVAAVKEASELEYQKLIEWRLTGGEVGELLNVARKTVYRWSTAGHRGVLLESRTFIASNRAPRAYRLRGVQDFAAALDLPLHYDALHPALQREWQVGPLAHLAKHGTLDNDERSPDDQH